VSIARPTDQPWFHLLAGTSPAVFVVPGSMLFDIDTDTLSALEQGDAVALAQLRALAPPAPSVPKVLPPVTALSLNVAQACNLACTYCYADKGKFGAVARLMDEETAFRGINQLIAGAAGLDVTVGFIGGEPFLNRALVHACVTHARNAARDHGIAARFAVTTNATLLRAEDIRLLRENAFAVTVSIDGGPNQNRHRPAARGAESTEAVLAGIAPLLGDPGEARIAARATVTRDDLDIAHRVEDLIGLGFQEIGVSPARTSARGDLALTEDDWPVLLENMIDAAQRELTRIAQGEPPRFSNFWVGLRSIHRGAARALPCGSAASYLSLDVDGAFYSCHRTVNKPGFRMGSLGERMDMPARQTFLEQADVDRQTPCMSCWARYLCGGGCHAEVAATGRPGCDFIRGWLEFCLRSYRLVADRYPALLLRGHA
jgi:uncharacterized protein